MTLERPRFLERCPGFDTMRMEPNRNIRIVRKGQMDFLTDKQVIDYYEHRKKFLTWLFRIGKNPEKAKGYSPYTVAGTADRTARFDLWRWNNRGGYSIPPTQEDATAYMEKVAYDDVVEYHQQFKREVVANLSDGWTLTKSDLDEWRAEVVGDA